MCVIVGTVLCDVASAVIVVVAVFQVMSLLLLLWLFCCVLWLSQTWLVVSLFFDVNVLFVVVMVVRAFLALLVLL